MKRLFIVLLSVVISAFAVACEEKKIENVSFRHTSYLIGSTEEFKVIIQSGERESPYVADGVAGEMVEFCIITLKPKTAEGVNKNYTFSIGVDGETYDGSMNKDLFGTGFTKDIGVDIGEKITSITFSDGEKSYPLELENMMANAIITESDAISIVRNEFKDKLLSLESEGKSTEIYVKFVCDTTGDESFYYWYVAHVLDNGDYMAVLLDIVSGDVIAKRGN